MSRYRSVITYGTFDVFHVGHVRLLRRLRDLADRVYVGVSTDEFNSLKGKRSAFPFEHRMEIVGSLKYVDVVFPEHDWDQKVADIERFDVDAFAMGDDWTGKFDFLKPHCTVIYLPRTQAISSTEIKSAIREHH